eukprot:3027790-Amphidinium_carterae.1
MLSVAPLSAELTLCTSTLCFLVVTESTSAVDVLFRVEALSPSPPTLLAKTGGGGAAAAVS